MARREAAAGARGYLDLFSSPDQPPNTSLHELDGSLQHWLVRNALDATHPYHEFLADHVKEEFGSIAAEDGQQLNYRLTKPAALQPGKRYPVIVDVYGGPHNQYVSRTGWAVPIASRLFSSGSAQHGFIVFTLDNRGSGFRGIASRPRSPHSAKSRSPISSRPRFLKTQGRRSAAHRHHGLELRRLHDPDALTTTGRFKAGVAGAPVTDWRIYDTHYTERYMGMPQDNTNGYEKSSVLPHSGTLNGKLLLVHGMADDNVLLTNSTTLMQALQAQARRSS